MSYTIQVREATIITVIYDVPYFLSSKLSPAFKLTWWLTEARDIVAEEASRGTEEILIIGVPALEKKMKPESFLNIERHSGCDDDKAGIIGIVCGIWSPIRPINVLPIFHPCFVCRRSETRVLSWLISFRTKPLGYPKGVIFFIRILGSNFLPRSRDCNLLKSVDLFILSTLNMFVDHHVVMHTK